MPIFPFSCEERHGESVIIRSPQQIHHIRDVLRYKAGRDIELFDSQGGRYHGRIVAVHSSAITIQLEYKAEARAEPSGCICLACVVPKGRRFDLIIQMATQLGVDEVRPLFSVRSVVHLSAAEAKRKQQRWQRLALASCKQSRRASPLRIAEASSFAQGLEGVEGFDLRLIATLSPLARPIEEFITQGFRRAVVLVGPEGDFTPQEVKEAEKHGCQPMSLGKFTLRVETAALLCVALLHLCRCRSLPAER